MACFFVLLAVALLAGLAAAHQPHGDKHHALTASDGATGSTTATTAVTSTGSSTGSTTVSTGDSGPGIGDHSVPGKLVDDVKSGDAQMPGSDDPESPALRKLSFESVFVRENWQLFGETLRIVDEKGRVVFLGDSPTQFLGMTTKTYNLNLPADKKSTESSPPAKGPLVAEAKIRKGCWFIFCAVWKKETWMTIVDVTLKAQPDAGLPEEMWVVEHMWEGLFQRGRWEIYPDGKRDDRSAHFVLPGQYGAHYRKVCKGRDPSKEMLSSGFECKLAADGHDEVAMELIPDHHFFTAAWETRIFRYGDPPKPLLRKELAAIISFIINRKVKQDNSASFAETGKTDRPAGTLRTSA